MIISFREMYVSGSLAANCCQEIQIVKENPNGNDDWYVISIFVFIYC